MKFFNCLVFEPDFRHGGLKAGGQDKYMEIIPHCQSDFDSLKIPFFLRSDNQYIVKSADYSGWIASPFRAFERSFVHRFKQVGWIIAKVRNCLVFEPDFRHGGLKAGGQDKFMEIIPHCQSLGGGALFRQRFLIGITWHLMDGVLQLGDL